jgi:hypothetical protein
MPEPNRTADSDAGSPLANKPWEKDYYHCSLQRWDDLETEIQRLLKLMLYKQKRFLVISLKEGNHYIQFTAENDGVVLAEAVSNKYLTGEERLNQATCRMMRELSWNNPGKRSPNFWKRAFPPVDTADLASLGVRTLHNVFEIISPTGLEIRRGLFSSERTVHIPVVERARKLFLDAGLPFPTIPEELASRLKEIDKWYFATRQMKIYPYFLKDYVMGTGRYDSDYVVLAHAGHGENSYAIHYYVVYRYLRLFMQLAWGGWHMDNKKEAEKIRACFALADQLVEQAGAMKWDKRVGRMTIVVSDYDSRGSYWVPPPKAVEGREGLFDVLGDALDCLRSKPSGPLF